MFVIGARKAGLPDCVPADKLKDMPNLIRVKSCDQQRAKIHWVTVLFVRRKGAH